MTTRITTFRPTDRTQVADCLAITTIVIFALALRLLFYVGLRGTDDSLFLQHSYYFFERPWDYPVTVTSARFGTFVPTAILFAIFGAKEWVAGAWFLACSLAEIALVFFFARSIWGRAAAVYAALFLALAPLHIGGAVDLLTDPALALFVTLSFCAFCWAERAQRSSGLYFLSGFAFGAAFWIKQQILVCAAVFTVFPLLHRGWRLGWTVALAGLAVMLGLFAVASWFAFGNPAAIANVTNQGIADNVTNQFLDFSPFSYFALLFHDYRPTFLMAYFAVWGAALAILRREAGPRSETRNLSAERFVLIWAAGLIAVLSFGVFSLHPLRFFIKQDNYMLIFLAPLALLAGFALSRFPLRWAALAMAAMFAGSIVISSATQMTERTTIASLEPAARFVREHQDRPIYGTNRLAAAVPLRSLFDTGEFNTHLRPYLEMPTALRPAAGGGCGAGARSEDSALVLVDPATLYLGWRSETVRFDAIPPCWRPVATLGMQPLGAGAWIIHRLQDSIEALPGPASRIGSRLLNWFVQLPAPPQPAVVYAIPAPSS